MIGEGLQEIAVSEPLGEHLEPGLREWVALTVGPSVEAHLEVAVGNDIAADVACAGLGDHGFAGLQVFAAVVVASAEAAYVQTIACALGVVIVGDDVVCLGILRAYGLPGLPSAAVLLAQEHRLDRGDAVEADQVDMGHHEDDHDEHAEPVEDTDGHDAAEQAHAELRQVETARGLVQRETGLVAAAASAVLLKGYGTELGVLLFPADFEFPLSTGEDKPSTGGFPF